MMEVVVRFIVWAVLLFVLATSLFVLDVVATEYSTNNPALEPFFVAPIIKLLAGILPFYH